MPIAPVRAAWTATFTNLSGALADPATVTFHVEAPDGTVTDYVDGVDGEVAHPSLGVYVLTLVLADVGVTGVRASASAGLVAQDEARIYLTAPQVAP